MPGVGEAREQIGKGERGLPNQALGTRHWVPGIGEAREQVGKGEWGPKIS